MATTLSKASRSLPTHVTLPSGDKMPVIALGVYLSKPGEVGAAVKTALKTGYRHIDGAWAYGNEEEVGKAIKESGVPREDIFITSKLWNYFHAPEDVEEALDDSLKRLGTSYVDLYLIHWPLAFHKEAKTELNKELTANAYPTWKKLEEMLDKGKVRNIGLSNFTIKGMEKLLANPLKYKPAVDQVELNYQNPQPEVLKWAKEHDIIIQAWAPLGGADNAKANLELPVVKEIAQEMGIEPAQVLISWHIQRGTVVLPKSVSPARVVSNYQVTALPDHLFKKLEAAACSHPPEKWRPPFDLGFDVWGEWPF
ncbi:hypothetical protein EIP91_000811 [Steccherinum ochraceum]|uniref:NADP-dependent oxidoreductase domain-containing protein n=1 Tax=Steccherinum ochraceum TaxID=92696 RepID=A0A4V2MWM6_9APHY|nr:hypothetical protein EIP91_000811 [Steccherinum ochraceum]